MTRPAVFFDRDGVINQSPGEGFVREWSEFRFVRGIFAAIRRLKKAGFRVFIVSNQSGVGRGVMTRAALGRVTAGMNRELGARKASPDAVYYCVHAPTDGCACRKPGTGLYQLAARRFRLDRGRVFVVGDTERDIESGMRFGARTVLVYTGKTRRGVGAKFRARPDKTAQNAQEAVRWILHESKKS